MFPSKKRLIYIGAIPPPLIGPNVASEQILKSDLLNRSFEVKFLDISDRRAANNIGKLDLNNVLIAVVHIIKFNCLLLHYRSNIVYLNLSQGIWGYLRDLGFILPSLLTKKQIVLHLRGSEFCTFYDGMIAPMRWLTRLIFGRISRLIVLGESIKLDLCRLVSASRISVIPNGINYSSYSIDQRATSKMQDAPTKVLFLSSLRERKGIYQYLESIPLVLEQNASVSFTVAGSWRSKQDKIKAEAILNGNNITSDSIQFIGTVSGTDKIEVLLNHDIFIFTPIEPEGLPWVILEAMSAGLPVISSNQGAIADVVVHDKTGLIVNPIPEEIGASIIKLAENKELAMELGRQGRARIETCFSEETYFKEIVNALKLACEH